MFVPSVADIIDIQQRYADGYQIRPILLYYGLDPDNAKDYDTVFNICHRRRRFIMLTSPEPWEPLCMTSKEYTDWKALMETMTKFEQRVPRPCDDCWPLWARARRDEGCCNGSLPSEEARAEEAAR